jgi:hypothetical protein
MAAGCATAPPHAPRGASSPAQGAARGAAWAVPGRLDTYELTDDVTREDCAPGRGGVVRCDLAPAWDRVVARCGGDTGRTPGARPAGCVVTIAPGTFRLSRPLRFTRAHQLRGAGGGFWGAATVLEVDTATSAFVLDTAASGFLIEGLGLVAGGPAREGAPTYGVRSEARGDLDRLWIRGFTVGVLLSADVNRRPPTAANGWSITRSRIDRAEHAGVLAQGGDANLGVTIALDLGSNCAAAARWLDRLGPCANLVDRSFFGVTAVATQTATARDEATGVAWPGFRFEGASQRAVCVGCYSEGDQPPSPLGATSTALGGVSAWVGPGLRAEGPRLSSLIVPVTPVDGLEPELALGGAAATPGTFLELRPARRRGGAVGPEAALRLKLDPRLESFVADVANLHGATVWRIGATPRVGLGRVLDARAPQPLPASLPAPVVVPAPR